MYRTFLISLLIASPLAQATVQGDANSALMENINRFNNYENTAQQMSHGQSNIIPSSMDENVMASPDPKTISEPTTVAVPSQQIEAHSSSNNAGVYHSIELLIDNSSLTAQEKMKLIKKLSS